MARGECGGMMVTQFAEFCSYNQHKSLEDWLGYLMKLIRFNFSNAKTPAQLERIF